MRFEPVRRPCNGGAERALGAHGVVLGGQQHREIVPGVLPILSVPDGTSSRLTRLLTRHKTGSEDRGGGGGLLHGARVAEVRCCTPWLPAEHGTVLLGGARDI